MTGLFQLLFQYLAGAAFHHLFFERASLSAVTAGSADKPAQMPALKLPGRALLLHPALFFFPARDRVFMLSFMVADKEEDLPFNMRRNRSPSLLVAVNGF